MADRFPGYDVLAKRDTPSWNEQTRAVVDERLAEPQEPHFFTPDEWRTLIVLCDRIVPQPAHRPRIPAEVLVDRKLAHDQRDGYRHASMPPIREAWRQGLRALDAECRHHFGGAFIELAPGRQDTVLGMLERGEAACEEWLGLPPQIFFKKRVLHDISTAYYAYPQAWNEIGFGGPASPRGYVRLDFNRRDPWEAKERKDG